jgi:quinol monooxygenase YgiN
MFVTITTSHPTPDEWKVIKPFMTIFIPKLRQVPGVHAVYFSYREDKGDETTFIVWENTQTIQTYRESPLFKEAVEFEKKHGLSSSRDGFPIGDPC